MEVQERLAEVEPIRNRVVDDVPRPVKEVKGVIAGLYGSALRDVLDIMETALANDRQFEIVKKLTMNIFGERERQMRAIVTRILVKEERQNGPKDSDNGNG